ncbi:MAG: hypothetical protein BTN85_0476 [Candidatus Methanohalarchaeum thermophilum]|uniref:Uncharacterized protein n=1 Tax=Methanohalarchaeum thermophilum TaxID=1903181 RepID=A0A1Q6DUI1_METT1|nr:MAG: hypothetical protein BTN85_0476 [Candidatus Methanohalarchaeum thermophilum]
MEEKSENKEYSLVDILFGVAGPRGDSTFDKILGILCVHRLLWFPWGLMSASVGLFLFMIYSPHKLEVWKIFIGLFAAGLLTRVISLADMLYDWWIGEDERLGPPNSTLPLVTGLLSPWTIIFFMVTETVFCLSVAYFLFNIETLIVAVILLIWGVTYSASPPLNSLTELQRRIYRSLSGLMAFGGVAMVAPDAILSTKSLFIALTVVIGCLSYHDKDSRRFEPLNPSQTIKFTGLMTLIEYITLFGLWYIFGLNFVFLGIYLILNIPKVTKILDSLEDPRKHETHIKLTHYGVITYTLMLLIINVTAIFHIFF